MKRDRLPALLASALALASCAPPPAPPALAPAPPPPPADLRWRAVSAPMLGASFELPGVPSEWHSVEEQEGKGPLIGQGLSLGKKGGGEPSYAVLRVDTPVRERGEDSEVLKSYAKGMTKTMTRITIEEPMHLGGFRGLILEGTTKEGKVSQSRFLLVGRSFYVLAVEASPEQLKRDDTERFFGSFRLALPWHVQHLPGARCTVAVPDSAMGSTPPIPGLGAGATMHFFQLGGEGELSYALAFSAVAPERLGQVSADEILDTVGEGVKAKGGTVEKVSPFTFEGIRGRELTVHTAGTSLLMRLRVFLVGDRFYQLIIQSSRPDLLEDASAQRFLDSFHPAEEP